jgi:hypothetical protein
VTLSDGLATRRMSRSIKPGFDRLFRRLALLRCRTLARRPVCRLI